MSRLEKAVQSGGCSAFSMRFQTGFPAEILSEPNPFASGKNVVFGDIIHPDDYQPFCEVVNEIIIGRSDEIKVHARILTDGEYKWYYISALAVRRDDGSLKEVDGMMFDVSAYLEGNGDDAVMRRFRKKSSESLSSAQEKLSLVDILGEDYLIRVQKPFSQISGLFSLMTDAEGNYIAVASGQDKRVNLNKMNFQRKKSIRVRHQDVASWIIASDDQELVDENAQLLETMVQTVAGIANSYVVLVEEMDNSQNANKLLGQNFEDQILINNIYSLILQSSNTKSAIGSIIPLITDYFDLEDILFCSEDSLPVKVYRWDSSGILLPVVCEATYVYELDKELDFSGIACASEKEMHCDKGRNRSCVLSRTYKNGRSGGVILFISGKSDRVWSNRDRNLIKNLTQILSTVIYKSFTEDELTASQERLERLAYYDRTTNIPNRSMFERDFRSLVEGSKSGAVIAVEITNIKTFSEIFSCEYADDIVKSFAEYISALPSNAEKKVYRFSNDILLITMTGSTREEARQFAQLILTKFRSPWYLNDNEHHLEVYAGVTIFPQDAEDIDDCIKAATHTLRLAKERKFTDAACYSEGLEEQLNDNQQVKKLIIDAMENDYRGFYFLFQPVVSMNDGTLHCCEANLFWGNEDMTVSRDRYLPIIDRLGLSTQMYRYAVDHICEFCASVRESGFDKFRVSFAIPENILNTDVCIEALRSSLLEYALPPSAISISVSESARTLNAGNMFLKQLSKIGVNIIADDSGESFFTVSPLDNPAVKTVKIRSSRFTDDPISSAYMRSVIQMAHDKGIAVCIRGVDNPEIFQRIRKFDVDLVEGIFNGRPLRDHEFIEKLCPCRTE